jgi:hypothetical protein
VPPLLATCTLTATMEFALADAGTLLFDSATVALFPPTGGGIVPRAEQISAWATLEQERGLRSSRTWVGEATLLLNPTQPRPRAK